jgi:hypothetical protein
MKKIIAMVIATTIALTVVWFHYHGKQRIPGKMCEKTRSMRKDQLVDPDFFPGNPFFILYQ